MSPIQTSYATPPNLTSESNKGGKISIQGRINEKWVLHPNFVSSPNPQGSLEWVKKPWDLDQISYKTKVNLPELTIQFYHQNCIMRLSTLSFDQSHPFKIQTSKTQNSHNNKSLCIQESLTLFYLIYVYWKS